MSAALTTRQLGKDGPQVTAQGWGAMGLSAFYGTAGSDEERFKVLDQVFDSGCRFWDSADIYGDSEDLLGKWFARNPGKREQIFLATKFAIKNENGERKIINDPEYIRAACDSSLKRLGVDSIDLYYCHRLNGKVPVETVVSAMSELVKAGKVKYIGISECSADSLRRACKVHHIAALQVEYSPWTMDIESSQTDILKTCGELGVAVVAYSPLGRGFLTGRYKSPDDFEEGDFRKNNPRFSRENFPKNLAVVDTLRALADKKGVTTGQLTLAWLSRQSGPAAVIPIPGTTSPDNLRANLAALKIQLTDAEDKEVRNAIESAEIGGDRYPAGMMGLVHVDTPPLKA